MTQDHFFLLLRGGFLQTPSSPHFLPTGRFQKIPAMGRNPPHNCRGGPGTSRGATIIREAFCGARAGPVDRQASSRRDPEGSGQYYCFQFPKALSPDVHSALTTKGLDFYFQSTNTLGTPSPCLLLSDLSPQIQLPSVAPLQVQAALRDPVAGRGHSQTHCSPQ